MMSKPRVKRRKSRTEIKWFYTEAHGYLFSEKYATHAEWHDAELKGLFKFDGTLRGELHCIQGSNWMCVAHVFGRQDDEEVTAVGDRLLSKLNLEGFTMISHLR
jgi:hypothetical protein